MGNCSHFMLASARHATYIYISCVHAGTNADYSRTVYYHKCITAPILYELQNAPAFADRQAGRQIVKQPRDTIVPDTAVKF